MGVSTPWLDAAVALRAGDVDELFRLATAPIVDWSSRRLVDWGPMTAMQRLEAVIRSCASGAAAGRWRLVIVGADGRQIPPPPSRHEGE